VPKISLLLKTSLSKAKDGVFMRRSLIIRVDGKIRDNLYFRIIGKGKLFILFILYTINNVKWLIINKL
jgi:hypothetical protein